MLRFVLASFLAGLCVPLCADIKGVVVDHRGQPVPGIRVVAYKPETLSETKARLAGESCRSGEALISSEPRAFCCPTEKSMCAAGAMEWQKYACRVG